MSGHEGIDPNLVGRREFIKLSAAAATAIAVDGAAVVFLGGDPEGSSGHEKSAPSDVGHNEVATLSTEPHSETVDTAHPEAEAEAGAEAHHEKFFDVNLISALPVVTQFGLVLAKNLSEGEGHREFGKASFYEMLAVESPRLAALKIDSSETSNHQFKHETTDLAISYVLMGALVTAAEVTEHADADEAALFEKEFTSLVYKMDKGLVDRGLKVEMPGLDDGLEAWEAYRKAKGSEIIELASQNFAIGTVIAPAATTYTSATMTNALNGRMSQSLAELKYAERVAESLESGRTLNDASSLDMMTNACEEADGLINGRGGYVEMTLSLSANLQGAGFFGDPPNFFYIKNNGVGSWLEASKVGISTAATIGFAENVEWTTRALGRSAQSVGDVKDLAVNSAINSAKVVKGMAESTVLVDQSLRRNKKFSDTLYDQLGLVDADDPLAVADLRKKLGDLPRSPFVYDFEGLKRAFRGQKENPHHAQERLTADVLFQMHHGEEESSGVDDTTMVLIDRLMRNKEQPKDRIASLISTYEERGNNHVADQLGRALSNLLETGELTEDAKELIETIREEGEEYTIDPDGAIATELADSIEQGDVENVDELIHKIDARLGFLPKGAREAVRQYWAIQTDSDVVDPDHKIGGLGHASKEVLAALATQILAANSCAVVASKFLDALGNKVPFQVKKAMVLTIDEGLSAVADNVVAYVSTEIVMNDMYEKEYGEDVFEGEAGQKLKDTVTSSALFAAVAGGALSKIGNGPNFKFEKPVPKVVNGRITTERELITLKETLFMNRHAFTNGGLIIAQAMYRTAHAEGAVENDAEAQEAHTMHDDSSRRTRRNLFATLVGNSQ